MNVKITEEHKKIKFENFQQAVRRFPTHILIKGMQDILLNRKSIFNDIYKSNIQKNIPREFLAFLISNISEAAILYSNSYRTCNKNMFEKNIFHVFKTAKEFFIDCLEISIHEDSQYNVANFLFRMEDYQLVYQNSIHTISIASYMFSELSKIKDEKLNGFDFYNKFYQQTNVYIDDFFKSLIVIYTAAMDGWFPERNIKVSDARLNIDNQSCSLVLNMLSSTFDEFKKIKNNLLYSSNNYHSKIFEFNLLRTKPLVSIVNKGTTIFLAPNPNLIINQAVSRIYYTMKDKCTKDGFTNFFGRLMEIFCQKTLDKFSYKSNFCKILNEDQIKTEYRRKNKPITDFAIINEEESSCVLVECKSARIIRDVIINTNLNRFTNIQLEHIRKAYEQITDFSSYLKENKYFKEVYGLILTYDRFPPISAEMIKQFFPDIKHRLNIFIYTISLTEFVDIPLITSDNYDIFDAFKEASLKSNPYGAFGNILKTKEKGKVSNVKQYFDYLADSMINT